MDEYPPLPKAEAMHKQSELNINKVSKYLCSVNDFEWVWPQSKASPKPNSRRRSVIGIRLPSNNENLDVSKYFAFLIL